MIDGEVAALVIAAGILLMAATAAAVAIVRRRRRGRRTVTLGAARAVTTAPPASPPAAARPAVTLGPARPVLLPPGQAPTPIRKGLPLVIPRREDPLWHEKGWRQNGQGYEGFYRAGSRRWQGLIRSPYPGSFEAYIWDPPLADLARRTSHRPCFSLNGMDGRFKIHFHSMPHSLDHSIASIEAVLAEAVGVRREGRVR